MSELEILKGELYGDPATAISDIKFYPGTSRDSCSIEDIAGIIRACNAAFSAGQGRNIDLTI